MNTRPPIEALSRLCRDAGIRRLSLFGSVARDEAREDSDVDLLVEFEQGRAPTLAGLLRLRDQLSALFDGRPVDLVTPSALRNPYRARRIRSDLTPLYAA